MPRPEPRAVPRPWVGWAALLAVYVLWGSTYDAIRVGVATLPPLFLAGVRYSIAGSVLLTLGRRGATGGARLLRREHWRSAVLVGLLLLVGGNGLVSLAEQTLPAGVTALLVGSVPLWMVLMDALLYRRLIRPGAVTGIMLGLVGVAVLASPGASWRAAPVGLALALLAAVSWAAGSLLARSAPQPRSPLLASGMQMLAGGLVLLGIALATGELHDLHPERWSWSTLVALAWLTVAGSMVGYSAYALALRALPTSTVATYAFANPLVAVAIGWGLLGERPTSRTWIAMVLIVASIGLLLPTGRGRGTGDRLP